MKSHQVTICLFAGLLALFAGERLFTGAARTAFSMTGAALLAISAAYRIFRRSHSGDLRRAVERRLLLLSLTAILGVVLYAVAAPSLGGRLFGFGVGSTVPSILAALSPVLLAAGCLGLFFGELSYTGMTRAEVVEAGRVSQASSGGIGVAAALTFCFAAYYVAAERDVKWDLSYFRTTRASEATRALVQGLEDPVTVTAFFPPGSDVLRELSEYLSDLSSVSPRLEVVKLDQAMNPAKAKELGVTGNGAVVLQRGNRKEQLHFPTELDRAKSQLRTLDQDFQKRLILVAREKRVVYFTRGHGERSERAVKEGDKRETLRLFRELLAFQNYELRDLSAANGLGAEVPGDAALVIVAGPELPFLPEEAASLKAYFEKGGRLLYLLEPDGKTDHANLLDFLFLKFDPVPLANEEMYLSRTHEDSDRGNLATTGFSSHPSVTSISQLGKSPLLLGGAGSLAELPNRPTDLFIDLTVRADAASFRDVNGNFRRDADEEKRPAPVAAAVSRRKDGGKEGRAIVLADVDALADFLIQTRANAYFAIDGAKWAIGEDAVKGVASTETDAPIQHTRGQDAFWFYGTVVLVPVLVIAIGLLATRKRKRSARVVGAPAAASKEAKP